MKFACNCKILPSPLRIKTSQSNLRQKNMQASIMVNCDKIKRCSTVKSCFILKLRRYIDHKTDYSSSSKGYN